MSLTLALALVLQTGEGSPGIIDLSEDEYDSVVEFSETSPALPFSLGNIQFSGFIAAGWFETGDDGARPADSFEIRQSHFFAEAEVWENVSVFAELRLVPQGEDTNPGPLTGELYAHFRNVAGNQQDTNLGLKVGRVDLPFGEEYLWQDQNPNVLISPSAAFPYGFDEG
ncbi:MAG: hypothetical protein AAGG01_19340, partial [Planctomycetota bacterium]